jgi:hypothetical protein
MIFPLFSTSQKPFDFIVFNRQYEIRGSHSDEYQDWSFMMCDAVHPCKYQAT